MRGEFVAGCRFDEGLGHRRSEGGTHAEAVLHTAIAQAPTDRLIARRFGDELKEKEHDMSPHFFCTELSGLLDGRIRKDRAHRVYSIFVPISRRCCSCAIAATASAARLLQPVFARILLT